MDKNLANTLQELLKTPQKIAIVGHKNPDGDAIGSCLALSLFLQQFNHEVTVVVPNDFPDFLKWMPGAETILNFELNREKTATLLQQTNSIFTLDFNAFSRTGALASILEACDAKFVMIDHHQQPDDYATVTYSDVSMSSTCEMVFHTISALGGVESITKEIATNLYTGIMTDTGSFRFPATTATTHEVIAKLIEKGASNSEIHQKVYDANSPERMKLLGVALNNMVLLPELNSAYITLTQKELERHHFKKGDTEGFVNYPLSIKGIIFSVIFIENAKEGITKISFRSKGNFSVNEFARNHFNGGGHTNAAGGRSDQSIQHTVNKFISILPTYKEALNDDA